MTLKHVLSHDIDIAAWACLGIVTPIPAYKLAWVINTSLHWDLRKKIYQHTKEPIEITSYQYRYAQAHYKLLVNKVRMQHKICPLIDAWKDFTHFLLMQTEQTEHEQAKIILAKHTDLHYIYSLNPETLRNPTRLLD